MTFEMVYRVDRHVPSDCKGFCKIDSDPECRLKSGTVGNGDHIYSRLLILMQKFPEIFKEIVLTREESLELFFFFAQLLQKSHRILVFRALNCSHDMRFLESLTEERYKVFCMFSF